MTTSAARKLDSIEADLKSDSGKSESVKSDSIKLNAVKPDFAKQDFTKSDSAKPDSGFNYDRYRKLLAEADDEPKRLAFINILIDEKARDQLARQSLRSTLATMGLTKKSRAD